MVQKIFSQDVAIRVSGFPESEFKDLRKKGLIDYGTHVSFGRRSVPIYSRPGIIYYKLAKILIDRGVKLGIVAQLIDYLPLSDLLAHGDKWFFFTSNTEPYGYGRRRLKNPGLVAGKTPASLQKTLRDSDVIFFVNLAEIVRQVDESLEEEDAINGD